DVELSGGLSDSDGSERPADRCGCARPAVADPCQLFRTPGGRRGATPQSCSWPAIIGLAVVGGFIASHVHAPVPGGSASVHAPGRQAAASSTQGLPAAPDVEIVMYQGDAAVGGSKIRLSQLWGKGKPVVLNYFAGLCPPCRMELPDFQRLYTGSAKDKFFL